MSKKRRHINTESRPESKTRIIGIVSGKGGVGKTTFSANLSIALNALDKKVVVIDCNVTTPHLSYYLGVKNFSTTINNVFSGDVDVAFAPLEQFGDLKKVDMRDLRKIVHRLARKGDYDFIILDSAPGLGREAIGVLHACNEIIFLTNPTAPNIRDVVRCNEVARMLGHKRFSMVLNMMRGKDHELTPERAEELFGMPVLGVIPFDENIMDSTAEGVPIMWHKPKSPSCNSFLYIAARLSGINLSNLAGEEDEEEEDLDEEELEERGIIPIVEQGYGYSNSGRSGQLRRKIDAAAARAVEKIKDVFSS
jgi:septum site-determining protein MinD